MKSMLVWISLGKSDLRLEGSVVVSHKGHGRMLELAATSRTTTSGQIPEDTNKGTIGPLGITWDSKYGMVESLGIPKILNTMKALWIPRDDRKGMLGTPGITRYP